MVFVKGLGVLDIISSLVLFFTIFDIVPFHAAGIIALYLIGKGLVFITDWSSWIDMFTGAYLLFVFLHNFPVLTILLSGFLFLKGLTSLAG